MDDLNHKRIMAAAAVVAWLAQAFYVLFPFDLLPDFIPLIGWVDDLLGLIGLAATTLWMVRTVREVGFLKLVGADVRTLGKARSPAEHIAYEPIPAEVLRSL